MGIVVAEQYCYTKNELRSRRDALREMALSKGSALFI